jgi:NAD-dependent dihydropyrimidine dehydrogenase PreA subunit
MSKNWYPVIDYNECTECGTCVDFCPHDVYDKTKSPTPVVIYPEGCIEGCKNCAGKCPGDAIKYVGDAGEGCGCDCSGGCCG